MPFIVATYVYASSQGQRTHSAQTKIDGDIWEEKFSLGQAIYPDRGFHKECHL